MSKLRIVRHKPLLHINFIIFYIFYKLGGFCHFCNLLIHSSANNFAMQNKRKTISGVDVMEAMTEMEFDRFVAPLKQSLEGNTG